MQHRKELIEYGYKWLGMREIPYNVAMKIVDEQAVYLLYEDNTESLSESYEDIKKHYANGGRFGIEIDKYNEYIVFVLGRDYSNILPQENDIAYQYCISLAKDFEISEYNISCYGILECLENYMKANVYNNCGDIWFLGMATLEEVCL